MYLGVKPDKMQLLINPSGTLVGAEVFAIHASCQYRTRQPIKYGDLAITTSYSRTEVAEDLREILEQSLYKFIKMSPKVYKNFQVILLVP